MSPWRGLPYRATENSAITIGTNSPQKSTTTGVTEYTTGQHEQDHQRGEQRLRASYDEGGAGDQGVGQRQGHGPRAHRRGERHQRLEDRDDTEDERQRHVLEASYGGGLHACNCRPGDPPARVHPGVDSRVNPSGPGRRPVADVRDPVGFLASATHPANRHHPEVHMFTRPARILVATCLPLTALLSVVSVLLQPEFTADPAARLAAIDAAGTSATVSALTSPSPSCRSSSPSSAIAVLAHRGCPSDRVGRRRAGSPRRLRPRGLRRDRPGLRRLRPVGLLLEAGGAELQPQLPVVEHALHQFRGRAGAGCGLHRPERDSGERQLHRRSRHLLRRARPDLAPG